MDAQELRMWAAELTLAYAVKFDLCKADAYQRAAVVHEFMEMLVRFAESGHCARVEKVETTKCSAPGTVLYVNPARYGDEETTMSLWRDGDSHGPIVYRGKLTFHDLLAKVHTFARAASVSAVRVDTTGLGAAVMDALINSANEFEVEEYRLAV